MEKTEASALVQEGSKVRALALTGLMAGIAVAGGILIVIPTPFARCVPVQHMVNVLCAVLLGTRSGVMAAFIASTLRILLGAGTFMAYPGSMCGALLSGLLYARFRTLKAALFGEIFGTGILGALLSYPVAAFLLGNSEAALFTFVVPFLVSTGVGSVAAAGLLSALRPDRKTSLIR